MRPFLLAAAALLVSSCDGRAPAPTLPAKVAPTEIIREPVWTRRPTPAEIEALRPKQAAGFKLSAVANLWCVARADGTLADCQIDWQDPPGMGFGEAALTGAPLYQIAATDKLGPVEGRPVEVRFSWKAR